jgi:hypothetical protein
MGEHSRAPCCDRHAGCALPAALPPLSCRVAKQRMTGPLAVRPAPYQHTRGKRRFHFSPALSSKEASRRSDLCPPACSALLLVFPLAVPEEIIGWRCWAAWAGWNCPARQVGGWSHSRRCSGQRCSSNCFRRSQSCLGPCRRWLCSPRPASRSGARSRAGGQGRIERT